MQTHENSTREPRLAGPAAGIAVLLMTLVPIAARAATQQGPWTAQAVEQVSSPFGHSSLSPDAQFRATARMDREARKVHVRWRYSAASDFGAVPDGYLDQAFAVRYTPSAVEFTNPDGLLVAGVLGDSVVVEKWRLKSPMVITDAQGTTVLVGQQLEAVDLVYSGQLAAQVPGIVRTVLWNRGKERSAFLRLTSTDALYELTWPAGAGAGALSMVLDPVDHPELSAASYDLFIAGNHDTSGFVYGFHVHGKLHLHPSFVLFDHDRDGTLDDESSMDAASQALAGLRDIGRWIEYMGQAPPL